MYYGGPGVWFASQAQQPIDSIRLAAWCFSEQINTLQTREKKKKKLHTFLELPSGLICVHG